MIAREIPFEIELIKNLERWLDEGRDRVRTGRSGQSFLGKITYGDLVGVVPQTPNGRRLIPCSSVLGDALGRIQEECKACGIPCLAAMVVRADTSFPGIGFLVAYLSVNKESFNQSLADEIKRATSFSITAAHEEQFLRESMESNRNEMNSVIAIIAEAELRRFSSAEDREALFSTLLSHYDRLIS